MFSSFWVLFPSIIPLSWTGLIATFMPLCITLSLFVSVFLDEEENAFRWLSLTPVQMDIKALFIRSVFYIHDTRRTHNTSWAQTNMPAFSRLCKNCSHMRTYMCCHNKHAFIHSILKQLSRLLPPLSFPFTDVKRYTRGHPRMLALCLKDLSTSSLVLPLIPSILLLSAAECRWFSFIHPSLPVSLSLFPHFAVNLEWQQMNGWIKWFT